MLCLVRALALHAAAGYTGGLTNCPCEHITKDPKRNKMQKAAVRP